VTGIPALQILACIVSAALARAFPFLRNRSGFLLLSLLGVVAIHRQAAPGYALLNGAVFAFTLMLERTASAGDQRRKFQWRWSCIGLCVLIGAFLTGRWFQLEARSFSLAGIEWTLFSLDMWLLLRLATFLLEFGSGRIARPGLPDFAAWACLPFTMLGPVLRYSQFEPQMHGPSELRGSADPQKKSDLYSRGWLLKLLSAAAQIACGVALVKLRAGMYEDGGAGLPSWAKLVDGFGISPWSFLLLWSGYYKLMECLALTWGVVLPPSFNMPFGRPNISEFWANWNMSATTVFRDYLFYMRWGRLRPNPYLNTMIIFFLVGLWHGSNWYWTIFGLMHGVGFCCFIWYRQRRSLKRFEVKGIPFQVFGRVVTYVFVCSCWIVPSKILKLLGRI
jgi:D-alanyl-lipoteichoic acid acyltransferase DltB (MBOAT superfamily)